MIPLVSRSVHGLAWLTGYSTRRALAERAMRIVMLHGVGDPGFPAEAFDALLAWLVKHYEIISLDELLHRLPTQRRISGREIALTFDDGLRNNVTVAWPALREHGAPATFFLCPGLIDGKRWLWNHEARVRLERLDEVGRAEVRAQIECSGLPDTLHDADSVVEAMKCLDPARRLEAEAVIRKATPGFIPSPEMRRRHDVMRWEDLGTVDTSLITFGSHTSTHPILTTLDDDALHAEVAGSRKRLEQASGRTVELFCYPNGAEDARVRACVDAWYRAAVSTRPGVVRVGDDPLRLSRVGVSPSRATMAWRLFRPGRTACGSSR